MVKKEKRVIIEMIDSYNCIIKIMQIKKVLNIVISKRIISVYFTNINKAKEVIKWLRRLFKNTRLNKILIPL